MAQNILAGYAFVIDSVACISVVQSTRLTLVNMIFKRFNHAGGDCATASFFGYLYAL